MTNDKRAPVKRYGLTLTNAIPGVTSGRVKMTEMIDGQAVRYEDYAALIAENERLEGLIEEAEHSPECGVHWCINAHDGMCGLNAHDDEHRYPSVRGHAFIPGSCNCFKAEALREVGE